MGLISSNCNSISTLEFELSGKTSKRLGQQLVEKCIPQIINSQQNLKNIIFNNYVVNDSLLLQLINYNNSNTLRTIIFYNVNFENVNNLSEVFEQLNVLESIHILYCYSTS